jgi:hypothetical protein
MSKSFRMKFLHHHFLNQITGIHFLRDSKAVKPNVSRNLDGINVK